MARQIDDRCEGQRDDTLAWQRYGFISGAELDPIEGHGCRLDGFECVFCVIVGACSSEITRWMADGRYKGTFDHFDTTIRRGSKYSRIAS